MIQETVFSALSGLVAGRVYPSVAPDGAVAPFIVYQRVGSSPENTLADGQPVQQTRMQIDAYATTYAAAQTLAQQIEAAMTAAPVSGIQIMDMDGYEADVKLHRVTQDYSIWYY